MKAQGAAMEDERPFMLGIRWMSVNGRSGWCNVWSDGTVLPILSGHDDGDDGGDDGSGDDGNDDGDGDEDDDDDDEDDDDKDLSDAAKARIKELSDEAAKHRVNRNKARTERDEARTELATVKAELAKLKKDGAGDETGKARITELEETVKTLTKERDDLLGDKQERDVERQVAAVIKDLKVDEDADYVVFQLRKRKMLKVDDDGEVEDLKSNVRSLVKDGTFAKLAAGGGEGDGSDGNGEGTSGARRTRSKSSKQKPNSQGLDRASLEKKYPALRR